jgi:hypothetical protein
MRPFLELLVLVGLMHGTAPSVTQGGILGGHVRDQNWYARREATDPFGVGYYEYAVNANGQDISSLGGFDDTDVFGLFTMNNLAAGSYTVVSWDVWWRSAYAFNVQVPAVGTTPDVDVRLQATMWGYPAFWEDSGYYEFGQTFVATGPISMICVRAPYATSYTLTVRDGGPDGARVGVSRGFSAQGDHRLIYGYGDMPTLAGQTYYVRIRTSSPTVGGVIRQMDPRPDFSDPMPGGCLWLGDGTTLTPYPDRDLGLVIMSDDDGLLTNLYARQGGGTFNSVSNIGQTFIARGVNLISAAFWLGDPSNPTYAVRVFENSPGGAQVGTTKRGRPARLGADPEMIVAWAPGECPLISGQTYYVEVTRDDGGIFNSAYVNTGNPFSFGQAYNNGNPVPSTDLAGTLMEEESPGSAARPWVRFLDGPTVLDQDRGSNHLTVCWTTDLPSDSRVEFAIDHPPYTGTVHDPQWVTNHALTISGLHSHSLYHYRVTSARTNYRSAVWRDQVVTTRPRGPNLLANPSFEEGSGPSPRDIVPGWTKGGLDLEASDGSWFSGIPPRSGGWFLQGAANSSQADGYLLQRVTGVSTGEKYTFSAWITTWMRENRTFKYDVWNDPNRLSYVRLGIDPTGGTDPNAGTIQWTPRVYSHLHYQNLSQSALAQANALTVFVRLQGTGGEWHLYGVDDCVLTGEETPAVPRQAVSESASSVRLRFSKAVHPLAATDLPNYVFQPEGGGEPLALLGAQMADPSEVVFSTATQTTGLDYTLSVSNVVLSWETPGSNFFNGQVPVLVVWPLADLDAQTSWKYNDSGSNLGTTWRARDFDDSIWPTGPPLLAREDTALSEPIRTPLSVASNRMTFYFRKRIDTPVGGPNVIVRLRQWIDDGVVYYLNGQEVFRQGVAADPVDYLSPASRLVGNAAAEGPFEIAVSNWVSGQNVFAAEVHQQNSTSSDVVFGAALDALVRPSQVYFDDPLLRIQYELNELTVVWEGQGWTLQFAFNAAGPWLSLPTARSPFSFTPTAPRRFFRLTR